jgi:hypothetical protein
VKFVADRPFADPEVAARKLMEIANSVEPVQDGRIHIEKIDWPFICELIRATLTPVIDQRSPRSRCAELIFDFLR